MLQGISKSDADERTSIGRTSSGGGSLVPGIDMIARRFPFASIDIEPRARLPSKVNAAGRTG